MNTKLTATIFSFLLFISFHSLATDSHSNEVALIFGETLYISDLEVEERYVRINRRSYPDLSDEQIFEKLQKNKLSSIIWQRINNKLITENDLQPSEEEITSYTKTIFHDMSDSPIDLSLPEMKEAQVKMSKTFVSKYKISKFLYETYGGKVIFQQANPQEPVGAYRALLEDYVEHGELKIYKQDYHDSFWSYYLRDHPMEIPKDRVDFSKPWWEKSKNK